MIQKFIIPGRLPGLNDYTLSCRNNKYGANKLKKDTEMLICICILKHKLTKIDDVFSIKITWYEKDYRRDWDNIIFAKKFILDALKNMEIIENDTRKNICDGTDTVLVDKLDPRIEVELITERT